jgi:[2Fe-2S] binding domain
VRGSSAATRVPAGPARFSSMESGCWHVWRLPFNTKAARSPRSRASRAAIGMLNELKRGVPSHVTDDLTGETIPLTRDELRERMSGNLCRCGAYNGIVDAITQFYEEGAE